MFHDIMILDKILLSWCPVAVFPSRYFTIHDLLFGRKRETRSWGQKGELDENGLSVLFQHVRIGSPFIQEVFALALLPLEVLGSGQVSSGRNAGRAYCGKQKLRSWINNRSVAAATPTTNKGMAKPKFAKQDFVPITVRLTLWFQARGKYVKYD